MQKPFPIYADQLVEELKMMYPIRNIKSKETLEDIHRYAGAIDVIEYLERWQGMTEELTSENINVFSP